MDMKDLIKKRGGAKAIPVRPAAAKLNAVLDKTLGKDKSQKTPGNTNSPSPAYVSPVLSKKKEEAAEVLDLPPVTELSPITLEEVVAGKFQPNYIYDVPIEWIDENDKGLTYNREENESDVDISDLEEDIRLNGQIEPGYVRINPNGLLQIEQGWRRYITCKKLGLPSYRCVITKDTDFNAALKSISLNLNRKDIPDYFKIQKLKQFSELFKMSYEEIGRKTGFGKKSYISQLMQIANYPPVMQGLKDKKFTSYQGMKICQKIKKENLSDAKVAKLIDLVHKKSVSTDELAYLDLDKTSKSKGTSGKKEIYHKSKSGSFSLRVNYDPKKTPFKDIEKTMATLKDVIEDLKKELKVRKSEDKQT